MAIFKRSNIDGHTAQSIAIQLVEVFDKECNHTGPSISAKDFENSTQGKTVAILI